MSAPKEERFTMLQTGVIDVSLDPIESMQENDQCSQAPYLVDAKILVANANSIFMNKDKFNSLPKEYQDILIETANEMKGKIGALVNGYTDEIVKEFEAEIPDFEYIEISDEEILEWAEMMDDVAYEWATDMEKRYGYPAHDIVRRYIEINRELGYEYPREWGTGN